MSSLKVRLNFCFVFAFSSSASVWSICLLCFSSTLQIKKEEKLKDCTVITIAYRLNTITDCEVILIMKNGEIDEIDSFEPLINDML